MKTSLIVLGSLVLSMNAFAGQKLSYEQVKESCRNPEAFQNQNKPANMEITCSDVQTKWVAIGSGTYTLPRGRKVTMTMTSDKYEVPGSAKEVAIENQGGECPRFKETIERVQTTRSTTCEEILGFNGTEIQFCAGALDDVRNSNPSSIAITDSGRTVHFCNGNQPNTPAPSCPSVPSKPVVKPNPSK